MLDLQYGQMVDLIQAFLQSWGSQFEANLVRTTIQNISLPQVARAYPWRKITKPYRQTLVVGTDTYALPYDFDKFWYVKSKYGRLTELMPGDFHERFCDRTDSSCDDIVHFCVEEQDGVQTQISTAETLSLVSSDASDTAQVLIRGEVSGYDDYEEVTMNGTTAVTTTKTFSSIAYVIKSAKTNGRITVSGVTSGTTFAIIPAEHLSAQYKRLILSAKPQEALQLYGDYISLNFKPQSDYDIFKVPADLVFMHALSLLSWERRNVTEQLSLEKKYKEELTMAIKYDRKSFNVESVMESRNESRKVYSDDNPIVN
jgi:hypothetical protein